MSSVTASSKPEILAPAGAMPQLMAAVHAGADAVYFGLDQGFNARVRAAGFNAHDLAEAMDYLRSHGCKGYLTLNTLIFDEELSEVEQQIRYAAQCGVDALIVQDLGVIQLARATAPNLPLHGSTQMSITDADGVQFAANLGIERVVVGRELSVADIASIDAETTLEIEAFVHGALCVSYSGQCFSSEAWGGRSANRGQCAQACRLPYGLLVDGEIRSQGDFNYLLSPQDLMALQQLPKLIRAGVSCFKIEGRLKGAAYVLDTVSAYREALDLAWERHLAGKQDENAALDKTTRRRLAQVFSRGQDADNDGLTPGFLEGPQHQKLVIGRSPRHRGLYLGRVQHITEQGVTLDLHGPVKPGDGVVFDSGNPQQREPGGNIFHLMHDGQAIKHEIDSGQVELVFGRQFPAKLINPGDLVWRTKDTRMDGGVQLHRDNAADGIAVEAQLQISVGKKAMLTLTDSVGQQVSVYSQNSIEAAQKSAIDETALRKAIGQLGDTPFHLAKLSIELDADVFAPMGEIKRIRREAVEQLQQRHQQHERDRDLSELPVLASLLPKAEPTHEPPISPQISLLCRTAEQVEAACQIDGLDEIIVDFLEVHGLKDACTQVQQSGKKLVVAAPRIFKPGEERLVRYVLRLNPDALLVRSIGLLHRLQQLGGTGATFDDETTIPALYGDFSLNAANLLSSQLLLKQGLQRLTPTHDVNAEQLIALAKGMPAAQRSRLEVIAHHHLPIFHTEHCVFARFLSHGNSYKDCGRPCETHQLHVRDPGGADHLVLADIGCRNTVFNAQAQSAAPFVHKMLKAGLHHFRIEMVDEPAAQVHTIVNGYAALLSGEQEHQQLWKALRQVPNANQQPQGVGLGSLAVRAETRKKDMKKPTAR